MNTRVLGRTGLVVSAIGFGAWAVGGNDHGNSYGTTDDETSRRAIRKAVGLGCTFFDTADVYGHGHSEELLGEVLSECSEQTCVATKGGANFSGWGRGQGLDFRPEYIRFACTESLRRLRRDCIDLYQLHNPSLDEIAAGSIFDMLDDLRSEGKIRFYGLSIHRPEEGLAAIEDGRPQTLQVVYNLADQRPARRLFPAAKAAGAGIIAREPLWNGFLAGKMRAGRVFEAGDIRANWPNEHLTARAQLAETLRFLERDGARTLAQAALRFVLANDAVSVVIPGAKTPEQVVENLGALEAPPLNAAEMRQIYETLFLGD